MRRNAINFLLAAFLLFLHSCAAKKEAVAPPPPALARIEVIQLQMTANRDFVGVKFRVAGGERLDPGAAEVYLIDESTGEKYPVVQLQRIGRKAEFSVPGKRASITSCSGTGREG